MQELPNIHCGERRGQRTMKAVAEKTEAYIEPREPQEPEQTSGIILEFPTKERHEHKKLRDLLSKWLCPTGMLGI